MLHNDNLFLNLLLSDDNFSSWEGLNKEHFFLFFRMTDDISPLEKTSQIMDCLIPFCITRKIMKIDKKKKKAKKKTKDEKIKRWDISNG